MKFVWQEKYAEALLELSQESCHDESMLRKKPYINESKS